METVKTLRFKLEMPILTNEEQAEVNKKYKLNSLCKGQQLPTDLEYNRTIADMVRFIINNKDSFMINNDKADIIYDYFCKAYDAFVISKRRNIPRKQVNQIVLRIKNKAIKLLNNQIKQSDLNRLKDSNERDA